MKDDFSDLSSYLGNIADKLSSRYDMNSIKKDLLMDKDIERLSKQYDLDENLAGFITYKEQKDLCNNCRGLDNCKQQEQGLEPVIVERQGYLDFCVAECSKLKKHKAKKPSILKGLHIPDRFLNITTKDVIKDPERSDVLTYFNEFIKTYKPGKNFVKGLYIHGIPGLGKTFILCALGNELVARGYNVTIIYYPDLIREIKASFGDSMLQFEKIEELKKVDILMLDDIGAEKVTDFSRDEILGPILQYRMLDEKPTFFTSNLTMKQLHEHLSKSESGINPAKGFRITERIQAISKEIELNGTRYRK